MGDLVFLSRPRTNNGAPLSEAWEAYLAARLRAEQTGDIEDGIAAGKAWAKWLRIFEQERP